MRGILWFDMWQKRQEVNKAFLYIKNPLIPVCYTHPACSWAAHGQRFIITHRGADRSHHPGNLWASPLPGEHSGVVYPTYGYNSFLRSGYSLLSFLCVCVCANGRCSSNPLKFCLPFSFPRQRLIRLGVAHSHGKPQPLSFASFPSWFFYSSQFPFSPEHWFYACPVCSSVEIIP